MNYSLKPDFASAKSGPKERKPSELANILLYDGIDEFVKTIFSWNNVESFTGLGIAYHFRTM